MKYLTTIAIALSWLYLGSCSTNTAKESAVVEEPATDIIKLTTEQAKAVNLQTGKLTKRAMEETVLANGYIEVPPYNQAVISPMVTGWVSKINFLIGDKVKKGQVMAELESTEYLELQQKYLEMKADLVYLEDEYLRQKKLNDENATAGKKFKQAESSYKSTLASVNGLKARLTLLGADFNALANSEVSPVLLLRAPISGCVSTVTTVLGKHTDPHEELFELMNTDHLHLELNVFEKDILKVKVGQKVTFTIPNLENKIFEGRVHLIAQMMETDRRYIRVHVHMAEDVADFKAGMYANATIITGNTEMYALPSSAVTGKVGNQCVYQQVDKNDQEIQLKKMNAIPVSTNHEWVAFEPDFLDTTGIYVLNGGFYLE